MHGTKLLHISALSNLNFELWQTMTETNKTKIAVLEVNKVTRAAAKVASKATAAAAIWVTNKEPVEAALDKIKVTKVATRTKVVTWVVLSREAAKIAAIQLFQARPAVMSGRVCFLKSCWSLMA
jgi:hypothetical protein